MLKIGLTGGIGSGKSTVAHYFAALGIPIIDADVIVHKILASNQMVFAKIFERYGSQALTSDNKIDRKYLRQIIFSNKSERHWLENLLHPLAYQEINQQLHQIKAPYCIVVVPLLLETGKHEMMDRVLVINSYLEKQMQRVMQRDNICAEAALEIIGSQADNTWRLSFADDIIDNNGSLENLQQQVQHLHEFYSKLYKNRRS